MKILLTGKPKSGKTTLLAKLLAHVDNKRGLVAGEVRKDDVRIGFDLTDNTDRTAPLARTNKQTHFTVGRYFVDVEALDEFIQPLFSFGSADLLYIDEIGQMQLYSSSFKELAMTYLNSENHFLGTITSIFEDEFVESVRTRQDILTCEITPDSRDELEQGLTYAVQHRDLIAGLSSVVQNALVEMGTRYLRDDDFVRFKKLFKNAVPYISQGKIRREEGDYLVEGNTNDHHVSVGAEGAMSCDCDLFHGRGQFEGQAGECSHIQAVTLLNLAKFAQPSS
jgi:nucleoside-triphosphatase THEP1